MKRSRFGVWPNETDLATSGRDEAARGPRDAADAPRDSRGGTGSATVESYSADDIANLLYMMEEEKLAGDVYEALYAATGLRVFDRIAASEDQHMAALAAQAEAIGLDIDTIVLLPAGEYADPALQALYDDLMAQASVSTEAALGVGVLIEETDIVDLKEAAESVDGTPLEAVYDALLAGSERHLAAFESLLA